MTISRLESNTRFYIKFKFSALNLNLKSALNLNLNIINYFAVDINLLENFLYSKYN